MMHQKRISLSILRKNELRVLLLVCALLLMTGQNAWARKDKQPEQPDTTAFFNGFAVSFDLVGLLQHELGSYGQYEGALRINLKDRWFPVVEVGWGMADAMDDATKMSYQTKAPYGRIGCDFNLMKNKHDINRIYGGLRYAYTSYKFDVQGPQVTDPVWEEDIPFGASDVEANYHWMEFVAGVDAHIWGPVRLGWTVRYKRRLFHDDGYLGNTWYVPGYGKQGNARLGGTFNVTLEF